MEKLQDALELQADMREELETLKAEVIRLKLEFTENLLSRLATSANAASADNKTTAQPTSKPSYAATVRESSKRSVLVANLDKSRADQPINSQSIENILNTGSGGPRIQQFATREDKVVMIFGSDNERDEAKRILQTKEDIKAAVKSITAPNRSFPVVALYAGTEDLQNLKTEIECRNPVLEGKINVIRPLSKKTDHVKIYLSTRESQENILAKGRIYINQGGNFSSHKIVELDLNREVRRCYRCHKYGHLAATCKKPEVCGRCAENHETKNCKAEIINFKCVNCSGNHSSGHISCPEQVKAVKRYQNFLNSQ